MTAHDDRARDEQPAPAGDDELREAGLSALRLVVRSKGAAAINAEHARAVLAEYDERGRERDAARAELERLHTWAGLMSLLDEHYPAEVMTGESGDPGPRIVALTRAVDELRVRDEAAKAVVQWWREIGSGTPTEKRLRERLNALARAHKDERADR